MYHLQVDADAHPRQGPAPSEFAPPFEGIDELDRGVVLVEHELSARRAAIDAVDRTGNKQAGSSWHEIPLMRGQDTPFLRLHPQPDKCGSVYVVPVVRIRC